jgi:diaminopimelate epimerase
MRLPFVKMSGAGNDFVVIDHERVAGMDSADLSRLALSVCARRVAVGADGLVTVAALSDNRAKMVYLNADGSRAGMCGNAGRCASRYAFGKGWGGETLVLEADDGDHNAEILGERVRLGMRDPIIRDEEVELEFAGRVFRGLSIDTGVPHVVLWVEDVDRVEVDSAGRAFRFAPQFQPEGTNVNFVQVLKPSVLKLRTYERGVEAETLACGTGAVAAGVGAFLQEGAEAPVEVQARGGILTIAFHPARGTVESASLEGDARIVYEGVVDV